MSRTEMDSVLATIDEALALIESADVKTSIMDLLVPPRCEMRPWDYGDVDQEYPCWIVLDHRESNTSIAYCEFGFGPSMPWGLIFTSGTHLNMGMDCQWYSTLEDAFRESMAWDGANPDEYEVR